MFVITPHSSDRQFAEKKQIVERLANQRRIVAIYAPVRPPYSDFDSEATIELLTHVDFVLADLSYQRPSSYFEVGFVQAKGKSIALVAETGTPIHQVIGRSSVMFYIDLVGYERVIEALLDAKKQQTSS
jgi:nucleoside 2-deoxyribosyltransferase